MNDEAQQRRCLMAELVKSSQEKKDAPLNWAVEVSKLLQQTGGGFPSLELGDALVSHLCWDNNTPLVWKFIDQAMNSHLVSSLHILALLSSRMISQRWNQPEAYRLYLELLSRHAFSHTAKDVAHCKEKMLKSVDESLHLSSTFGLHIVDLGQATVLFLFHVITNLVNCSLEDWGLHSAHIDKQGSMYMDVDIQEKLDDGSHEHRNHLRKTNAFTALEVVEKLVENKKATIIFRLVHWNMPEKFNELLQRLDIAESHKLTSSASQQLSRINTSIKKILAQEHQLNRCQAIGVLIDVGSCGYKSCHSFGVGRGACWIAFDIYMENVMDGKKLHATSAIDVLAELIRTLKVMNYASWQETFQALWISALRLVQREREPLEGPVPHLDARLCILLSITPLAIARVVGQGTESNMHVNDDSRSSLGSPHQHGIIGMERDTDSSIRHGLVSALQILGQFSALLSPPPSVVIAANNAAAKASNFITNLKGGNDNFSSVKHVDTSIRPVGNMRHLIVEACIARKLIDTSSYFWPGYVSMSPNASKDSMATQGSPWLNFMEGAPLTIPLRQALSSTPASSVSELEKLYHIALNGVEDEKYAAAKILCGASLIRGWNIQEHTVQIIVKLLSPPEPPNFSGSGSHLVAYSSVLSAVLFGLSSIDTVHILSLYGMLPEVAASLLPICEVFGSLVPSSHYKLSSGDETSSYAIFSCAFLFLLRLWKFYRPPHEHYAMGHGSPLVSEMTLEYLLLLHHSRLTSCTSRGNTFVSKQNSSGLARPIYVDLFPKLKSWYCQNQACIASTLSGLSNRNPVHQVANKILNMIFRKMNKSGTSTSVPGTPSSGSLSSSSGNTSDDVNQRPVIPAWDMLEAIPLVLDAILTACAHGRLSSRDMTTGLKDLIDFLPASLATIISYFSAEITRGIWKPVLMNGTDWPSPAANLPSIEAEMKEILAPTGVNVPSPYTDGTIQAMLPLPMAALVSLTITFKLDKSLEFVHGVAGSAMDSAASGCPWPSMHIVGALWAQKVRRWHDFIVFSCCRSIFGQDKEAVTQLLRSCFSAFLGSSCQSKLTAFGGVSALLGNCIGAQAVDSGRAVAPGFFYLRTCTAIHDKVFLSEMARRLKCSRVSLAAAAAKVKEIATLGASLLCVSGGGHLVKVLYQETLPTWLLSANEKKTKSIGPVSSILEGYVMAYLVILSGSFIWGVGIAKSLCPKMSQAFGRHVDFLGDAIEGKISLGCDIATWKAYVSCFVGLVVTLVPTWVAEVKPNTLKKLAIGLRGWHESELALSLLERGGPATMGCAANLFM
ncbi:mediator of RNA polymerase II transcription subunit 33A-like isoform X2 [Nymphaea colorata]|uniref:mediator of RNA polymerase II transcription subunit 33A-like isoform X2 n=1 Tax=Nymphaea colorata TaxID=210225 RepID=UPI00214ED2AB|nr:mediator of RNA polymerase II transcription subunit 33A-like isoform X2 [Nymphaea colorata]